MKAFLDTSVFVAAYEDTHPHYAPSLDLLSRADKQGYFCAAHTLAEIYSVLTRLPLRPRVSPEDAMLFLSDVLERVSLVTLTEAEYIETLETAAAAGITGGQIYDALLARCAIKTGAETLYTWNIRHFERVAPELAGRVRTP